MKLSGSKKWMNALPGVVSSNLPLLNQLNLTEEGLSRSQTHVAILMEEMEHYGIILHSVKEVIDDTPMGKFARMVLAFVTEMEREEILDRTTTGKINKARDGKVVSDNKALYGWKWMLNDKGERDHLVLDEDQAAVLRQAGQEYADGVTYAKFSSGWKPKVYPGRAANSGIQGRCGIR